MTLRTRTVFGVCVITALGWQVWCITSAPLYDRLQTAYLSQAEQFVVGGDFATAREYLAQTMAIAPNDAAQHLSETIDQIAVDPYQERAYMVAHGNEARAAVLDQVLRDYSTPKDMLIAAVQLYSANEPRLADVLVSKAIAIDPTYSGLEQVKEYANNHAS